MSTWSTKTCGPSRTVKTTSARAPSALSPGLLATVAFGSRGWRSAAGSRRGRSASCVGKNGCPGCSPSRPCRSPSAIERLPSTSHRAHDRAGVLGDDDRRRPSAPAGAVAGRPSGSTDACARACGEAAPRDRDPRSPPRRRRAPRQRTAALLAPAAGAELRRAGSIVAADLDPATRYCGARLTVKVMTSSRPSASRVNCGASRRDSPDPRRTPRCDARVLEQILVGRTLRGDRHQLVAASPAADRP